MIDDTKFHNGDLVKVIQGNHYWQTINGKLTIIWRDLDCIGSTGVIRDAHKTQECDKYALNLVIKTGLNVKCAWYQNEDLKLII